MNKLETIRILAVINTAYPRFEVKEPEKIKLTMELWQNLLDDYPYSLVDIAVRKLIIESPFPPTIADVTKRISEIKNPRVSTAADGWKEVQEAIHNYGSWDIEGAMNSISPFTKKVVETIGFKEICQSENIETTRAQFRMAYEQTEKRQRQDSLIPDSLKMAMASFGSIPKELEEKQ